MEVKSITASVVEHLRLQIITGELTPGQKLNETELASRLNISRPPLREAFRILENEYLVVYIPRKVTYVRELSIEDLQEVYNAREMLECYAIDLLKKKNTRELPNLIESVESASNLSIPSQDNKEEIFIYLKTFANFHKKLVESANNSLIVHFYNSISSHLARYQFMYLYIPGTGRRSIEEHQQIIDLIKMGSYEKAKKFLREHINYTFEFLKHKIVKSEINDEKLIK